MTVHKHFEARRVLRVELQHAIVCRHNWGITSFLFLVCPSSSEHKQDIFPPISDAENRARNI